MCQFQGGKKDKKCGLHKEGVYLKVRDNANECFLSEGKEKTLGYYNSNADSFVKNTVDVDFHDIIKTEDDKLIR